jgi:hypothetical protein
MCRKISGLIRAFIAVLLCASGNQAHAALECDQVVAVAQTTVKLRDGGASLNAVMREIESGDLRQKLDAQELNLLRQVVRISFTSEASVAEIFESCKAGEFGLPKPKPKPKP